MKKLFSLLMMLSLCFSVVSCAMTDENQGSTMENSSETLVYIESTSETVASEVTTDQNLFRPTAVDAGLKIRSDMANADMTPYTFVNTSHFYSADGFVYRGTGCMSLFDVALNTSIIPRMTVKNGFSITAPKDVVFQEVTLLNLDGTAVKNAEGIPSDRLSDHMMPETDYVARFYANKTIEDESGKTIVYYVCYVIVGIAE